MTIVEKKAEMDDEITPYQMINMLLSGALERIDHAIEYLTDGELDEAFVLVEKTQKIVLALKESLDMEAGGDIAINLSILYEYIQNRLLLIDQCHEPIVILNEVRCLLSEVYLGWEGISQEVEMC